MAAPKMLRDAADAIASRGVERDNPGERSMACTVKIFEAASGVVLTESQGWQFMVCLKMARSRGGNFQVDDFIDGAAYMALQGECDAAAAEEAGK